MIKPKLTGRRRHRILKRLFRDPVLVLQLEVEGFIPEYSPSRIEGEIGKWWIDASVEHLLVEVK